LVTKKIPAYLCSGSELNNQPLFNKKIVMKSGIIPVLMLLAAFFAIEPAWAQGPPSQKPQTPELSKEERRAQRGEIRQEIEADREQKRQQTRANNQNRPQSTEEGQMDSDEQGQRGEAGKGEQMREQNKERRGQVEDRMHPGATPGQPNERASENAKDARQRAIEKQEERAADKPGTDKPAKGKDGEGKVENRMNATPPAKRDQ
jgi:hypothetical protein